MSEQMDKTGVLKEMSASYDALEEILASLDKTQFVTEGVIPGWSVKDMLAHIASWHHRLLRWLDAAVYNQEPTISGPNNIEEMDALNAQFYQENKARPLDEVQADFRSSYKHILDFVQAMPENDLINPQRFAWSQGEPLWQAIAGDTYA